MPTFKVVYCFGSRAAISYQACQVIKAVTSEPATRTSRTRHDSNILLYAHLFLTESKVFLLSINPNRKPQSRAMAATKMDGRGPSKDRIELFSPTYFGACALGGILSCGPTHTGTR